MTWNASIPAGCNVEVYARAADVRAELEHSAFQPVTNNAALTGLRGRYMEVRLALVRNDVNLQPIVYDLTLHGMSAE